jgi:MoaA/NifB/PqqE/SkfB family radical SAM enzyme
VRDDVSRQSRLKVVSLETMTACNQKCYFCPVSIAPREDAVMPVELFENIVNMLTNYRPTIESVFLQSYNEPTLDRRFLDQCRTLFAADLPVAVLSNGTGLTPAKIDAIVEGGPLRYLCINLSTLDRDRYQHDRGEDHLAAVLRNLDYAKHRRVADRMNIVVLGTGDATHDSDFAAIRDRFAGSRFDVERHVVMDRAGWLDVGLKPAQRKRHLAGCDNVGSRPLQHLHITPKGKCVLCCEDYDEKYVVGDLTTHTIAEVLESDELARMRRWVYGIEEAPDDFMCRNCIFARER